MAASRSVRFPLVDREPVAVRISDDDGAAHGRLTWLPNELHAGVAHLCDVAVEVVDFECRRGAGRMGWPFLAAAADQREAARADVVFSPLVFSLARAEAAGLGETKDALVEGAGTFHVGDGDAGEGDFGDL